VSAGSSRPGRRAWPHRGGRGDAAPAPRRGPGTLSSRFLGGIASAVDLGFDRRVVVVRHSGGHLGPDEPGELAGDSGDHDVAVGFAFIERAEPAAQADLGRPRPGHSVLLHALVAAAQVDADPRPGLVGPGRLDQLGSAPGRSPHSRLRDL
jgi:hypothetical protein